MVHSSGVPYFDIKELKNTDSELVKASPVVSIGKGSVEEVINPGPLFSGMVGASTEFEDIEVPGNLERSLSMTRTGKKGPEKGFLLLAGIFMAGAQVTHFVSLGMAPAAYMISVKRLSMVFGVILGWLMFHEENIRYRLFGASVMVVGSFILYP